MLAALPRKMTFLVTGCATGHCSGVSDKQRPIKKKWAGQELRSKSQAVMLFDESLLPKLLENWPKYSICFQLSLMLLC